MSIESLSSDRTNEDNAWSQLGADSEKSRKVFAAKAGLPEDATWEQINRADSEKSRKVFAAKAGLPEDATWGQINRASLGGSDDKFGDNSAHE